MRKSKTERLEGTDFACINNCCKHLRALNQIIEQCRFMDKAMLQVISDQIESTVNDIQYNCLNYLDLLEEGEI